MAKIALENTQTMPSNSHTRLEFTSLCRLSDLTVEGRGFEVRRGDQIHAVFLIPTAEGPVAYRNRCPHTGVNLDWVPDRFLDRCGKLIQCATHGARFRIHDGFCVSGPCQGDALESIPVRVIGDQVEIALPA